MKFIAEAATKYSGRLGSLVQAETGQQFQTPILLQSTKGGSIPHLSREVFKFVTDEPQILEVCLATTDHMEDALREYTKGFASFVGFPEFLTFLRLKDPCETVPPGYHVRDAVPFFTKRGKREINAESYMDIVESFKPDIYHSLCDDDTNSNSSKKRIVKSVDRTENFFNTCLQRHKKSATLQNSLLFAPLVGGYCKHARLQSIKSISSHSEIGGFMIEGLHSNGETAKELNRDNLKEIVSYCLNELNSDKPKMMLGAYNPLAVLELIQLGVDIFDTAYVYIASTNYQGLVFDFDLNAERKINKLSVDLNNESYSEDFTPVLQGCTCLTCQKHTKSYIHHLIKTKELLGPILLMIHNSHHYLKYFENIRKSISSDKLPELIKLVAGCIPEEPKVAVDNPKETLITEQTEHVLVAS